jgi:CotS family spore coat protein
MPDLENEIKSRYDIDFKGIVHLKDLNIINTSKGKKVLKKCTVCPERIHFIHGAKEHLYLNDFKNIDRYLCTNEGEPYFNIEGNNYTINDLIEGNECNFDLRCDIINASKLLAYLHKASRGYIVPECCSVKDELGKLPVYYSKRLEEIKKLKKAAKRGKSKFDYLFLKYVDYFYSMGEESIEALNESKYNELAFQTREEGIFCHHDFTYRNIINGTGGMSVINFEYCCYEIRVYDLANFLRRKMRKCNWNTNEAGVILDNYNSVESLSRDEFVILKLLLKFPQKFWRVSNKYYNSRRSWSEKSFIDKLQEVIDEAEYHKNFIEKFDSLF